MPKPEDCRFTKEHEWVFPDGDALLVGITDFAQKELGDIVYVDLGENERRIAAGDEVGTIESVKAVVEVYAPVSGQLVEINVQLTDAPEMVNEDPTGEGWLFRMKADSADAIESLLTFAQYSDYLEDAAE